MMRALLLLLVLASPVAHAEPTNVERAIGHYKQAKAYQDAGQYAKAAAEYEAAYRDDPRPETLFNIGQSYRLANEREKAIASFKQYLDAQPGGVGADEARRHIATLTKEIEDAKALAAKLPPAGPAPVAPGPVRDEPSPRVIRRSPVLRWTGVGSLAGGAAAIGLGVKLGLDARDASTAISQFPDSMWTGEQKRIFEDGQRADRNAIIAYSIGGALAIAGGVMFWYGSQTRVEPVVTATGAGAGVAGRF
jgi:tetratricopeptide (TPR) repeat protein